MARILRRRVVQMPKVASSRRNLASEINQYLQLGLNAGQIIEKIIPDDPKTTPEAYGETVKARLLGTGQDSVYDQYIKREIQQPSPSEAKVPLADASSPAPSAERVVPAVDNMGNPAPEPEPMQAQKAYVSQTVTDARRARGETFRKVMANFNEGLAIVRENSNPWNRGEKIDKYIAAFERNLAKSPLMNSGSAKARRAAVDVYRANLSAATAQMTRESIESEGQKGREATADNIERRAVLKEQYRVAKLGGDKELEKFKQKNRVDTEKLRQRNRRGIESYKQGNRDKNRAAKALMGILTKKPSKTQAEKSFITEMKQKDKAVENYDDAMTKLQALLAMESTQEVFLLAESDLNDDHRQIREDVDAQIAIVEARRAAHSAMLQRLTGLAGQDSGLLEVIPNALPAFEMPVWVPEGTAEQPAPADAQNAGGDADPAVDTETLIKIFNPQ